MIVFEFEKLKLYQEARAFRMRVYKLAKLLPREEFKLRAQMRDAARSLTNCIAEGHGRYTYPDRIHFSRMARGSLCELVDDVNLCKDEEYAKAEHLETLREDAAALLKRTNGYLSYLEGEAAKSSGKAGARKRGPTPPITNYQLPITGSD